jgi:hypothetical protein
MNAHELLHTIMQIRSDEDHLQQRRILSENYEWLEHFWRYNYGHNDDSIYRFITDKGDFYWSLDIIKEYAKRFVEIECVGSNKRQDYSQNREIARATMYLRYSCNLFGENQPDCISIGCRGHKIGTGFCNRQAAHEWKGDFNPIFAFKALIYIIRQVRNNLFHGHKLSLEQPQYSRNVELVRLASHATEILVEFLVESEKL